MAIGTYEIINYLAVGKISLFIYSVPYMGHAISLPSIFFLIFQKWQFWRLLMGSKLLTMWPMQPGSNFKKVRFLGTFDGIQSANHVTNKFVRQGKAAQIFRPSGQGTPTYM